VSEHLSMFEDDEGDAPEQPRQKRAYRRHNKEDAYSDRVADNNASNLARSKEARDIFNDYPPAGDMDVRNACERDLQTFLEVYFPAAFDMAWSDDHVRIIKRIEDCILHGGLMAIAMPRGGGKTAILTRAAIWALLYGHRRYVAIVAAAEDRATKILDSIKTELQYNTHLARDFRQVCYPIFRLENSGKKAKGQLFAKNLTSIEWGEKELILPTMPDWACDGKNVSGATVTVMGITGNIKGAHRTLATGQIVRPDLVLADDPQTRESAMSPGQSNERLAILNGDVLGMAGPGKKIAAFVTVTVVRLGDMADCLLDRKRSPRWQGERCKMLYSPPKNEKEWEQYAEVRRTSLRQGHKGAEATAYYRERQATCGERMDRGRKCTACPRAAECMDCGAVVAWPARKDPDDISAIQNAMNIAIDDPATFASEYQNDPPQVTGDEVPMLTAEEIANKLNGIPLGEIPKAAEFLTAFFDVHDDVLYWLVVAWSMRFQGWIVDYGCWPDQGRHLAEKRKAAKTLAGRLRDVAPENRDAGIEGAIRTGLMDLGDALLTRKWIRADGVEMKIERCFVDTGHAPKTVLDFCRYSQQAAALMPSRGVGIGPNHKPMVDYARKEGDKWDSVNGRWFISKPDRKTGITTQRVCRYDTNFWKDFVHDRLAGVVGDHGSLSLYGNRPEEHRAIADHLTSEFRKTTFGFSRNVTVNMWEARPGISDNHWFDCLVGATVAASTLGVTLAPKAIARKTKRERVSLDELRRRADARQAG
jgi:hypothetical protein